MAQQDPSGCPTDKLPRSTSSPPADATAPEIPSDPSVTGLDRYLGPVMYWVSVGYLVLVAGMQMTARHDGQGEIAFYVWTLAFLQPLFVAEAIAHFATGGKCWWRDVLYCVLPPFRLGGRDHVDGQSIWLPRIGWARVDDDLQQRVERAFSAPMILFALLVLPILGVEFYWMAANVERNRHMTVILAAVQAVIWYAFTVEFIIMFSIVRKKFRYCKEHLIDIAIICLPLISFLRMLRVARVLRLQQLSRVARVYRLRGLSMRMFRGILVLGVIHRLLQGKPEKRLPRLREQLAEKEAEIERLRAEIVELERLLAEKEGETK